MIKALVIILIGFAVWGPGAHAEVGPVAVRVPETKAWVGQRVPFFVELRARGSFVGAAGFDLPQLPGTLVMKIGNPVVSSQEIEGESWFIQAHEFALFSQKPGLVHMPAFSVRFAAREGFTGPAKDVEARCPAWEAAIRRPPGSEAIGFLVTTESLEVAETWDPQPGKARIGTVFKRTIVQHASQLSAMALAPAPAVAPEGIRVYVDRPEIIDRTERGEFLGERRETLTYLLQKPGTLAIPPLTYVWWNPKTEALQSVTLPAVGFEVVSSPAQGTARAAGRAWPRISAAVCLVILGAWQRRHLWVWARRFWKRLHPPERAAAHKLLSACRRHDTALAWRGWTTWRNLQSASFQPGSELRSAVLQLERHLFGPQNPSPWQGDELARAFRDTLAVAKARAPHKPASALPLLNP